MNKSNLLSFSKDVIHYLTAYFPLAFSMAVCLGFGKTTGAIFACIAILFASNTKSEKIMPVYLSYMLLGLYADNAMAACVICGILLIISSFFFDKLKKLFSFPAVSGVMLATSLTVTVLFTTDYFGIGATGATVTDMIKSYISLGFHPNWRGVLYGTIAMVIMITFPRKFKTLSQSVSASFIAIAVTLILNLFLNPLDMATSITEIADRGETGLRDFLLTHTNQQLNLAENISVGISLFITSFYAISSNENSSKKDYIVSGIANSISGGFFNLPLPYGINQNKKNISPRIIATAILILLFCLGEKFILRIPLHSCAVVLIVGAWQSVKWGEFKKVFTGFIPVIFFTASVIGCLVFGMVYGVLFAALISILFSLLSKNNVIKDS